MTNCFPQQFVSFGQASRQSLAPRRIVFWLLALFIIGAMLLFLIPILGIGRPVPAACKDDQGQPVVPIQGRGTWAIILNFNHPESTTETEGCWAIVKRKFPVKTVSYRAGVTCNVVHHDKNSENKVAVGDGKAAFDGSFHIECPRRNFDLEPKLYETFFVHARVQFPEETSSYTVFSHQDISVSVSFEEQEENDKWRAAIVSTYGSTTFTDMATIEQVPERRFGLQSTVLNGEGTHLISRKPVQPRVGRDVPAFDFDYSEPFVIGDAESSWTLYNMIIDPPDPSSGCC